MQLTKAAVEMVAYVKVGEVLLKLGMFQFLSACLQ